MEEAEDTLATPETRCPGLPGRGCGHFIAGWDDHLLCVTCRPRGEPPCDGTFSCPVCSVWDQDRQLRLTQRPAKKRKSCSVTSASPPPPSEVNLEPVEFVDQPSYSSAQPTPLTLFSHPAEMSNVLANINTSLLHISSMLGSRGERSGGNEQAAPSAAPQTSEPLPTLQSQLLPPVTRSYSVDPLLRASTTERRSSSPGSRDLDASDVNARSRRHGQTSTERRDRLRSTSSCRRPDRSSSPLHQDRSTCSRERQPGYRRYRSRSRCRRRYRSRTRSYSRDRRYRTQRRDRCTGYASSHGSRSPRRWSRGRRPRYSRSASRSHRSRSGDYRRRDTRRRSYSRDRRSQSPGPGPSSIDRQSPYRSRSARHTLTDPTATPGTPAARACLQPTAPCRDTATQPAPSPLPRRSRSRSQSADRQLDDYDSPTFPYPEKIAKIRELFADDDTIRSHPPSPPRTPDPSLASRRPSTTVKSTSLPWNPSTPKIIEGFMDQLTGKDPKAKSPTGLGPGSYLRKPSFRDKAYRISLEPAATHAAQVPPKFRMLQPADKSTSYSRPSFTDSDLAEQEVQLKRTSVILSHQDWFLGSVLHFANRLGNQLDGSDSSKADLAHLQEFVYSASRAGFDARRNVSHLWFNTVLRRRDAYLSDTFTRLQAPLKRQLRAHSLDSRLLFSEETCDAALETYTQASNATLLSRATRTSRPTQPSRPTSSSSRNDRSQQRTSMQSAPPKTQPSPRGKPSSTFSSKRGGAGGKSRR